jgi:hypothetical protein
MSKTRILDSIFIPLQFNQATIYSGFLLALFYHLTIQELKIIYQR